MTDGNLVPRRGSWASILLAVITVISAVGLLGVTKANAQTYPLGDYVTAGVNIRTGPNTSRTIVGLGYPGQQLCLTAIVRGERVNGSRYWGQHINLSTPKSGYSHASLIGVYQPIQVGCVSV